MCAYDETVALASNTGFKCGNESHGTLRLTVEPMKKTYTGTHNQSTALDYDINVMALVAQYYNGVGPSNIMRTGTLLDLPNADSFRNHIYRRQSIVGKKIR